MITFSTIVEKLLFEITARTYSTVSDFEFSHLFDEKNNDFENKNISFLDVLDCLLRQIAVLDPIKYLKLVRKSTDNYIQIFESKSDIENDNDNENNKDNDKVEREIKIISKINPVISNILSGLLDHGDMLLNFMK